MISFAKIDLNSLLALNIYYSLAFIIIYYFFAVFLWHSAFHYIQTNSVVTISRLSSLPIDSDIITLHDDLDIKNASEETINKIRI